MLRTQIVASVVALAASVSFASAGTRPDTRSMTCSQAQSFVQQSGAVVMTTGEFTYDRFVADLAYCDHGQRLKLNLAPTADAAECTVGFYCQFPSREPKR